MKIYRQLAGLLACLSVVIAACATTPRSHSARQAIAGTKKTIKPLTGQGQMVGALSVMVKAGQHGQKEYTTTSLLPGARTLQQRPAVLLSESKRDGVIMRFYYKKPEKALAEQTPVMAARFITALTAMRKAIWPGHSALTIVYSIRLVNEKTRVERAVSHVFDGKTLRLEFYARALPVEIGDFSDSGRFAHETYHLMLGLFPAAADSKASKAYKTTLEEAGAYALGHCVKLLANGWAALDTPLATLVGPDNDTVIRTGTLSDRLLQRYIDPEGRDDVKRDQASSIFGPMIFATLWAEFAGQNRTVIMAVDPAAKKLMNLCRHNIWPPQKLVPVLQKMAGDGVDPPELLRVQDMAAAQEGP